MNDSSFQNESFLLCVGEVFSKSLTAAQGSQTRDALARNVYSRAFEWTVQHINDSLRPAAEKFDKLASCIGILDIFGFEKLHVNSLEQLCVNFSAEVLHKVN